MHGAILLVHPDKHYQIWYGKQIWRKTIIKPKSGSGPTGPSGPLGSKSDLFYLVVDTVVLFIHNT